MMQPEPPVGETEMEAEPPKRPFISCDGGDNEFWMRDVDADREEEDE